MAIRDITLLKDICSYGQQPRNLYDRAGSVPVVHDHDPHYRRTFAIHLSRNRQGGQVCARLCV